MSRVRRVSPQLLKEVEIEYFFRVPLLGWKIKSAPAEDCPEPAAEQKLAITIKGGAPESRLFPTVSIPSPLPGEIKSCSLKN